MNNDEQYEEQQRLAIAAWKAEVPSIVNRFVGRMLSPVTWLAEKAIPQKAIEGALGFSNAAARKLAAKKLVRKATGVDEVEVFHGGTLRACDEIADKVHNVAVALASVEGGAAGFFGILSVPADVPAIVLLALCTIHTVGLCYGYESKSEFDDRFMLGVLSAAGANSIEEKTGALAFLRSVEVMIAKQTWKHMTEVAAERQLSREGAIIAIRTLAKELGINLTKRKALAVLPFVGVFVGASVNGAFIKDVGWAARRAFQERWLEQRAGDARRNESAEIASPGNLSKATSCRF